MKGGKQPEDLFSHFDFDFRLQSSCWREGAVSGLPHVVLLLSHCFARTYVGIWYICICRYICAEDEGRGVRRLLIRYRLEHDSLET